MKLLAVVVVVSMKAGVCGCEASSITRGVNLLLINLSGSVGSFPCIVGKTTVSGVVGDT